MTDKFSMPQKNNQPARGINRREALLAMGAAATVAYAGSAAAAMPGHDHSKHKPQYPAVLDAANNCTDKGQRCIAHCLVSFIEGDTELAECASKVHEMQAICGSFSYLVAANSEYSKEYAKICISVCEDCEKVCREHEEHFECKDCADACEALVKAIKKSSLA
jgi:Cys-rich four helix bundle protein (predicted Tat secretion target)